MLLFVLQIPFFFFFFCSHIFYIYCKYPSYIYIYPVRSISPLPKEQSPGLVPHILGYRPATAFNLSSFRGAAIARRHNLRVRRGFQVRDTDSLPSACLLRLSIFLCAASYGSLSSATAAAASPEPALQSCLGRCPSSCLALGTLFFYFCYCYSASSRPAPLIDCSSRHHLSTACLKQPILSLVSGGTRAPLLPRQRPSCHGGRPRA